MKHAEREWSVVDVKARETVRRKTSQQLVSVNRKKSDSK